MVGKTINTQSTTFYNGIVDEVVMYFLNVTETKYEKNIIQQHISYVWKTNWKQNI